MQINLSSDDLKIIGNAITWTLYTPFYRGNAPVFSDRERERLQSIFDSICLMRQEAGKSLEASMTDTELIVRDSCLTSKPEEVHDIITCVACFHNEIGHSATEVSAVTGLSSSLLTSLLERLSAIAKEPAASRRR